MRKSAVSAIIAIASAVILMTPLTALASEPSGPPGATVPITQDGTSGGLALYDIYQGESGSVAHNCVDAGAVGGIHAIACGDVYALAVGSTKDVKVYEGLELYCQGSSGYAPCYATDFGFVYAVDNTTYQVAGGCGDADTGTFPACNTNARNYFYTADWTLNNPGDCHDFVMITRYITIYLPNLSGFEDAGISTPTVRICDEA
ncbi:MAG TPA: hypothetical protein VHZ33_09410 [Trebonia sp.]|jgi:hypothetical protein|nr:hypothetical protein [Trebonia sp.]